MRVIRSIAAIGTIEKSLRMPQERFSLGDPYSGIPCFRPRAIVTKAITRLNISARSKTMWTLPPLWTHRTRPQGFGNLAKNARFPQRPHRSSFSLTKRKNEEHNHSDQLSTESDHPQLDPMELRHPWNSGLKYIDGKL
jgi:hypothetical protein